jgi:hypothetical protein
MKISINLEACCFNILINLVRIHFTEIMINLKDDLTKKLHEQWTLDSELEIKS